MEGGTAGVLSATLMVAGNIMGSGIFMVPVALAEYGSVSTVAWALTVVAVACLALVYAKLSSLDGRGRRQLCLLQARVRRLRRIRGQCRVFVVRVCR